MLNKESVINITNSDKKYEVLSKEKVGDLIKIDFRFDEEMYFGLVTEMGSSGNYKVIVKGIYGKDEEGQL